MQPPKNIVQTLNAIEWRKPTQVTPEAEALVEDFLKRSRFVISSLVKADSILPGEAFDVSRTAAPNSVINKVLTDTLFKNVTFRGAEVRETIILPIVSFFSWDEDPTLKGFENPWKPVMELYKQGYTTDFDVSPDWDHVSVTVGFDSSEKTYQIV